MSKDGRKYIFYVCSQVAIKIIDKTQLNPGSLQKVSFLNYVLNLETPIKL